MILKFVLIDFNVFSTLWVFDPCHSLEWGKRKALRCHKAEWARGFSSFACIQWHWSKVNGSGEVWRSFSALFVTHFYECQVWNAAIPWGKPTPLFSLLSHKSRESNSRVTWTDLCFQPWMLCLNSPRISLAVVKFIYQLNEVISSLDI